MAETEIITNVNNPAIIIIIIIVIMESSYIMTIVILRSHARTSPKLPAGHTGINKIPGTLTVCHAASRGCILQYPPDNYAKSTHGIHGCGYSDTAAVICTDGNRRIESISRSRDEHVEVRACSRGARGEPGYRARTASNLALRATLRTRS